VAPSLGVGERCKITVPQRYFCNVLRLEIASDDILIQLIKNQNVIIEANPAEPEREKEAVAPHGPSLDLPVYKGQAYHSAATLPSSAQYLDQVCAGLVAKLDEFLQCLTPNFATLAPCDVRAS